MKLDEQNVKAFYALLRAGLWETDVRLSVQCEVNFNEVYRLADFQAVTGLIAAGLEKAQDVSVPKETILVFAGRILLLVTQNEAMNGFIANLVTKMHKAGINPILVKGQGIAHCYEKPYWRSCGDVDFLINVDDYEKAKDFLKPLASTEEPEDSYLKHSAFMVDNWMVELHGNLRTGLSARVDRVIDRIHNNTFKQEETRVAKIGGVEVSLPSPDNDVIFIFTHFLKHFFKGGIGVRQICDWCRLLWTYRTAINCDLLEKRIREMRVVTEWRTFAAYAVTYLGMPKQFMPLYSDNIKWKRKAKSINKIILCSGTFGDRDLSYKNRYPLLVGKTISFFKGTKYYLRLAGFFPKDAMVSCLNFITIRFYALIRGE